MSKTKSSIFSSMSNFFSGSSSSCSKPTSSTAAASATQYNKTLSGESFEGENDLLATVFSKERLAKMHKLAMDHQPAQTASDIIELRNMGVTVNKTLIADYSKYVSTRKQNHESSETFLKWLNIKTGPSMMEAPSMYVIQQTQPGKAVNKVEMREFGPSGSHYDMAFTEDGTTDKTCDTKATSGEMLKMHEADKKLLLASKGDVKIHEVSKAEMVRIRDMLEKHEILRKDATDKLPAGKDAKLAMRLAKMKDKISSMTDEVHTAIASMEKDASSKEAEESKNNAKTVAAKAQELLKELDEYVKKAQSLSNKESSSKAAKAAKQTDKSDIGSGTTKSKAGHRMSAAEQTELVATASRRIKETEAKLKSQTDTLDSIISHVKSTGTRSKVNVSTLASDIHGLVQKLMQEREKNERLMALSVDTVDGDAKLPILDKAEGALGRANAKVNALEEKIKRLEKANKKLTHDNDVFSKDAEDLKMSVDHHKATSNSLMGQNMDFKKAASREQYQKELYRNRAADISQRLASVMHFHNTDEDGKGNATVYVRQQDTSCDCKEFEDAVERNEVDGEVLLASTQTSLKKCKVGKRMTMELHNVTGLTDARGEFVDSVQVERMSDKADGTVRGRLINPLMLGKHTIQNEMHVAGGKGNYYALTLNAR